jgi:hypothetical protein
VVVRPLNFTVSGPMPSKLSRGFLAAEMLCLALPVSILWATYGTLTMRLLGGAAWGIFRSSGQIMFSFVGELTLLLFGGAALGALWVLGYRFIRSGRSSLHFASSIWWLLVRSGAAISVASLAIFFLTTVFSILKFGAANGVAASLMFGVPCLVPWAHIEIEARVGAANNRSRGP